VSKATNVTAWKGTVQCRERSNNSQSRTVAALTTDKTKQQSPVVGY